METRITSRKVKNKKYHTQIHDHYLLWLCTGTSIKSGEDKQVVCVQTAPLSEMMR
jgi:hypothetical protein